MSDTPARDRQPAEIGRAGDQKQGFSVSGFSIGHWTHESGGTGCTVILTDERSLAVADVRGGAPGTREIALLDQGRLVQRIDAVLLTGGSAFGLSAADGVVRWLREQGRGFPTRSIRVPIVPTMVLFDLVGQDPIWPGPESGYAAVAAAGATDWRSGRFGAGAGATCGKMRGRQHALAGGLGCSFVDTPLGRVAAAIAVNAVGDIVDDPRRSRSTRESPLAGDRETDAELVAGESTTIGVVVLDGEADRDALVRCAVAAHDGMARAIVPAHTVFDGDAIVVVARREGRVKPQECLTLTQAVERAVFEAIAEVARSAV